MTGRRVFDDMDDDIREHLERETADNIARGMAPDAAREAARRAFGNIAMTKEDVRAVWIPLWFDRILQDVRGAFRMFRRSPGFASIVVLTLALGIGMNTAVFSVVNAVLLRPLAYQHPERLMWIVTYDERARLEMVIAPDFLAWRDNASTIERMAAFSIGTERMTTRSEVVMARIATVSAEFWDLTGATPALGRLPSPGEDAVVLTSSFFQRAFGGDRSFVGRPIDVNGRSVVVAAVLPATFRAELPQAPSASQLQAGELDGFHATVVEPPGPNAPGVRLFNVLARLKPGVSIERATSELAAIRANQALAGGRKGPPLLRVEPYAEKLVGRSRTPLLILLAAVLLVLAIAAANIANLMLARGSARRREIAIRVAVGAGRGRVLAQFIVESMVLALIGGVAGLFVARAGLAVMLNLIPYAVPRLTETSIDGRVLAFAFAISVGTAFVFGVIPALAVWRANPQDALQDGARAATSVAGVRTRRALVVAEIALASVLLVGASLMIKSLWRITEPPQGFTPEQVLTMRFQPNPRREYIDQVLQRTRSVPGVIAAGISSNADMHSLLRIEGAPDVPNAQRPSVTVSSASPGYASAIGMRVLRGRWFADHEPAQVVVLNEAAARRHFQGQDPIGHRLFIPTGPNAGAYATIVGLVADLRYNNLEAAPEPELFIDYEHTTQFGMTLAIRTAADPMTLAPAIRTVVADIDKTRPVFNVRTLESLLTDSIAARRFNVFLLATFAGTALLLALIGIYGVMAYSVVQRTHEIGVRLALGAERRAVVAMIVRQGMALACAGIALGVISALALTRVIAGLLYDVTPTDPATFAAALGALAATALMACGVPALRAALVNPIVALRCD